MLIDNKYGFEILIRGATLASEYPHSDGKTYIEGRSGSQYNLKISNRTNNRIMAIVAIDGLSIIDNEPAGPNSNGYLIKPNSENIIPGWRLNDAGARPFKFCDPEYNFWTRTQGTAPKSGTIGVIIFEEEPQAEILNPFPGMDPQPNNDIPLGGFQYENTDNLINFKTRPIEFKKRNQNKPDYISAMYYESLESLKSRGIVIPSRRNYQINTNPFPNMR